MRPDRHSLRLIHSQLHGICSNSRYTRLAGESLTAHAPVAALRELERAAVVALGWLEREFGAQESWFSRLMQNALAPPSPLDMQILRGGRPFLLIHAQLQAIRSNSRYVRLAGEATSGRPAISELLELELAADRAVEWFEREFGSEERRT